VPPPLPPPPDRAIEVLAERPAPANVAVVGGRIAWSESSAAGGTDILKLPLDGGEVVPLHQGEFIEPNALAVDATDVYWTDASYEAVVRTSPK
jgi:hypothetical protein